MSEKIEESELASIFDDDYEEKRYSKIKPEVYENNDYRIEYRTRSPESNSFSYKCFDKTNNMTSELKIDVREEVYNIDGECKITYREENKEPVYLSCLRPSAGRRRGDTDLTRVKTSDAEKYKNEPKIGGHREWDRETNLYPYVKNIDDVMSVYRALKKGDFEINAYEIHQDRDLGKRKDTVPNYTQEQAVEKILNFMDTYIFNTEESREVLSEYMQKYPLPLRTENTQNDIQIPHKEHLKKYPSGATHFVDRLKNWKIMKLFSRDGRK